MQVLSVLSVCCLHPFLVLLSLFARCQVLSLVLDVEKHRGHISFTVTKQAQAKQ